MKRKKKAKGGGRIKAKRGDGKKLREQEEKS